MTKGILTAVLLAGGFCGLLSFYETSRVEASGNVLPLAAATPAPKASNAVCPDPAAPCDHKNKHFDDWELSFKMPAKLAANKPYNSAKFYGIILRSFEMQDDCDGGEFVIAIEKERKTLQKRFPHQKVFASYECPNMGAVDYDFAGKYDAKRETVLISNFIAIYAGSTLADADTLLEKVKADYPDAVVKQMNAHYERIEQ